jgi:hypothetical protein
VSTAPSKLTILVEEQTRIERSDFLIRRLRAASVTGVRCVRVRLCW